MVHSAGVAIARDAIGNVIITGDGNQVAVTVVVSDPRLAAAPAGGELANPYRGLDAFRETDSARFFGREDLVRKLWTRFHALQRSATPRLLPILGASGSGKSSLVRAGLVPELVRQPMGELRALRVRVLRPGAQPLARLAEARADAGGEREHELIFVDQLEEVFTECASEPDRAAFLTALADAASELGGRTSVVFAMRSDFTGALIAYPAFADAVRAHAVSVSAMTRDQLSRAIAEPARALGRPWPSGLVEALVVQCEGRSGALPLLQFALTQLWTAHVAGTLDERRWSAQLIEDFLVQVADALVGEDVNAARERIVRRAFTAMVQFGEGSPDTRRTARLSEIVARGQTAAEVRAVVDAFAAPEARLVTIAELDGEPTYELAHEALIGAWGRLRAWLGQVANREDAARIRGELRLRRRLRYAAEVWRGDRDALWRPPELEPAVALDELPTLEHDFVAASLAAWQAHGRWRRRVRTLGITGAIVFVVGVGFFGLVAWVNNRAAIEQHKIAVYQRSEAESSAHLAEHRLIASEIEQGRALLFEGHPMRALAYLLAARAQGADTVVLRALWGQATTDLPLIAFRDSSGIERATFSPDGTRVVTTSVEHTARVWDATTGTPLTAPLVHHGAITYAAFTSDGARVITTDLDGALRTWDARTGRELRKATEGGEIRRAAASLDGTRLVTVNERSEVRVWDTRTGEAITPPLAHERLVHQAALNHDGTLVLTASIDGTARIWDVATARLVALPLAHEGPVLNGAFSPDGARVATVSKDGRIRVWRVATGALTTAPWVHEGVSQVRFTADGAHLVTVDGDDATHVWDAATGKPIASLGNAQTKMVAAFARLAGTRILLADRDQAARVWDVERVDAVTGVLEQRGDVQSADFTADGTRVLTASDDGFVRVWRLTATPRATILPHRTAVRQVAFDRDGKRLVTISDHLAQIWDAATGAPVGPGLEAHGAIASVAWSRDGARVLTASEDGTAAVWDAASGRAITDAIAHRGAIRSASFSPDGQRVVTASDDETSRVSNAWTGETVGEPFAHGVGVTSAAFSDDGARILTVTERGRVSIWDAASGRVGLQLDGEARGAVAAWSPDGTHVIVARTDGEAQIWDVGTSASVGRKIVHRAEIRSVAWSPDGTRVVTASLDTTARVWNARTGDPITDFLKAGSPLLAATFSPDGAWVLTVGFDDRITIWDVQTSKRIIELAHPGVVSAVWSPDGARVATGGRDGTARIWTLPIDHGSLADWQHTARCAPFALVKDVLDANPAACE